MTTYHYKRGDRLPGLEVQLLDAAGNPYPLTGASIGFVLKAFSAAAETVPKVEAPAVLVDGELGIVRYDFAAGDLDTVGRFRVEWVATFPGDRALTFPRPGYDEVVVAENLGVP